jgi:urea carboxylase
VAGNLWRVLRAPGDAVGAGEPVAIVEAMKTEISVTAPAGGVVRELRAAAGAAVMPGQILAVLETGR